MTNEPEVRTQYYGTVTCTKCRNRLGDFIVRSGSYKVMLSMVCPTCWVSTTVTKETNPDA